MRITIDRGGRVVIPKALRDALHLTPGIELSVVLVDGRIEIEVPTRSMQLERREGALVAVADEPMPTLTSEQVRDTLEQVRR